MAAQHDAGGRGARANPPNRFERLRVDLDEDPDRRATRTEFLRDDSQSIISYNDSPDLGFDAAVNPYRGCEHGCPYCYARPYHEYLGFSAGLDFESKIVVKPAAPDLLRKALADPRWVPQPVAMSGVTDCYQPAERRLALTRACLRVLADFRNPVAIVTKNHLVTRDADHLAELAALGAACVHISITTLDTDLARRLEPRASAPEGRLRAIRELSSAGIPVGVLVAPVIPGLNDHEIPSILAAARGVGASRAGYSIIRLPGAVKTIFADWLEENLPLRRAAILDRIAEMQGPSWNAPTFGDRMRGRGQLAAQIRALFDACARRTNLPRAPFPLATTHFRNPSGQQMQFDLPRSTPPSADGTEELGI